MTISVSEYAAQLNISRQAVLKRINNRKLPKGTKAKKVGNTWIIENPKKIKKP